MRGEPLSCERLDAPAYVSIRPRAEQLWRTQEGAHGDGQTEAWPRGQRWMVHHAGAGCAGSPRSAAVPPRTAGAKPSTVSPNSPPWEMGASRMAVCWPPARCSRLPGQAWPSALGPVRRWRQHPRGAAPPHLYPQRTWTHPPMLRSTSYLQMAHRMKCWAPCGTDQRNHPGTGRDVRCVRSKRSVGACPAERLLQ